MLEIIDLNKSFKNRKVISHENFSVNNGEILGLIGQNGAGKTTTFKMILDLLKPDSGTILWNKKPLTQKEHNIIGFLPEDRGLYPNLTVEQQIVFFAELRGQSPKVTKLKIQRWMDRFDVKGKPSDKVKLLSKGNQQKVQLISTLIHDPKFIILDEPFSGLDPVNAGLLKKGIKDMKDAGATIIYSSHDMANVEQISDKIIMLKNGRIVLNGTADDIKNSYSKNKIIIQSALTKNDLENINGVMSVKKVADKFHVEIKNDLIGNKIASQAISKGALIEFIKDRSTLEEIFQIKTTEPKTNE
ncbi:MULTISPECIES: ABC transporter ATP-binding protein [Latilactobacillus]|uniref:Uncharacterized protein lasY n=1 Tax=Latilactobacillus sakei TaxID=1599 RepID=Q9AEC8_LATSK|nr:MULTISPECIES: ATP-binding cassette domain-containing protein [Latilactobacillus]ASN13555.1 sodium ABC transporter ATP-binding protein [Latilactobacillus sakei]MCM1636303.1 ATP-binding cassette domain-containing protein [Latilactobacillus sakei]MCW8780671.1 ATP-binding cassette domain-containing protein [Latilactobacillus curvatus]USF99095.1 sodium ABC transporter ATP-binding protein [Latilactobacillus sakei]UTB73241.1 sodium ABC transporter ATP-binding protein [Latilactobacillus curvatus]